MIVILSETTVTDGKRSKAEDVVSMPVYFLRPIAKQIDEHF